MRWREAINNRGDVCVATLIFYLLNVMAFRNFLSLFDGISVEMPSYVIVSLRISEVCERLSITSIFVIVIFLHYRRIVDLKIPLVIIVLINIGGLLAMISYLAGNIMVIGNGN